MSGPNLKRRGDVGVDKQVDEGFAAATLLSAV